MNRTWDFAVTCAYFGAIAIMFFCGIFLIPAIMVAIYIVAWKRDLDAQKGRHKSEVTHPIRFVREFERDVVFYFGKHHRNAHPGLHVRIPIISQAAIASLQRITFDVPDVEVKLPNDIYVKMDWQIAYWIVDDVGSFVPGAGNLYLATYRYQTRGDLIRHLIQVVQQEVSQIAGRTLGTSDHSGYDVFVAAQSEIVEKVQEAISRELNPNGIEAIVKMTQAPIASSETSKGLIDEAHTSRREAEAIRNRGEAEADVLAAKAGRTESAARKAEAEGIEAMSQIVSKNPAAARYASDRAKIEAMEKLAAAGNLVVHDSSSPNSPLHLQLEMQRNVGGEKTKSRTRGDNPKSGWRSDKNNSHRDRDDDDE